MIKIIWIRAELAAAGPSVIMLSLFGDFGEMEIFQS
jgi:hypothetical protein